MFSKKDFILYGIYEDGETLWIQEEVAKEIYTWICLDCGAEGVMVSFGDVTVSEDDKICSRCKSKDTIVEKKM